MCAHSPMASGSWLEPPRGESAALDTSARESTPISASSLTGSAPSSRSSQMSSAIAQLRVSPDSVPAGTGLSSDRCRGDLQHSFSLILPEATDCPISHQVLLQATLMVGKIYFFIGKKCSFRLDGYVRPTSQEDNNYYNYNYNHDNNNDNPTTC